MQSPISTDALLDIALKLINQLEERVKENFVLAVIAGQNVSDLDSAIAEAWKNSDVQLRWQQMEFQYQPERDAILALIQQRRGGSSSKEPLVN